MTNPTPRDSAQLPPKPTPTWARDHHGETEAYTWPETQAYAREALRAQAASVEPVGEFVANIDGGGVIWRNGLPSHGTKLYAGAPPAHAQEAPASLPADVEARFEALWSGLSDSNRKLVADYVKHNMPAHQPQAVAAGSPATAVDAVDVASERLAFEAWAAKTSQTFILEQLGDYYDDWLTDWAWKTWKGRAALQASRQPQAQQAVAEGAGDVREALRMGIECLRNWKVLHPENYDATDERAVALLKAALAKEQRS